MFACSIHAQRSAFVGALLALAVGLAAAQATTPTPTVIITATRTPQQVAQVLSDVRVIDADAIRESGATSLPELLQSRGGVEIAMTGGAGQPSGIFLRGSNANHVVLLVDGVRINSVTAGTTAFENIPLAQIERIEILRGPASSLYGADAIGGVIQIFTTRGERTSARVAAGTWRTHEASVGLGRRIGETAWSLQAGYLDSRSFSATNAALSSNFDPDNDPYRNRHVGATVEHPLATGHSVTARVLYSDGRTHYDDFGNTDAVSRQRLSSAAVELRNRLGDDWRSLLRLARGSDHRADAAAFPFFFNSDQDQLTWQNDLAALGGQLAAGIEWRREAVSSDTAFDRTRRHVGSAFASYAGSLDAHLLQVSLRHDDDSQFGGRQTGNVAYGYRLGPAWRLSAGAGTAFKSPTFNDLYFPGFANPDLRPERSRSAEVAARYDDGQLNAALTVFQSRVHDLIQFDFVSSRPLNVASARNRGATLGAGYAARGWNAGFEWTHQNPVDAASGERLPRRARDYASAHAGVELGRWRGGIDVVGSSDRVDNAFAPPPPRLAGYGLVHLNAAYALTPELNVSARLHNALDQRYELVQGYNTARRNLLVALEYAAK